MHSWARFCIAALLLQFALLTYSAGQTAFRTAPIGIDASLPIPAAGPADFHGGTATNPDGGTIGMNARYLTLDGKPWLPVMGEFHYSRVPANEWEDEILKMKAAGVQIVAAYVIWIHHEEVEGRFDWSGNRDLRRFVELCAKHGMYVYPRIGPWDHGEVRNGGFPDWLLKKTKNLRSTDPVYLSNVQALYGQIGNQLHGLLWKDGGPVIGIQLENEYSQRGPGQGAAYILQLKRMAIAAGLDVPIYSVTGWDHAVVPKGQVVAVFGGYPDAPWDSSIHQLPAEEVYAFRFGNRVSADMGAGSAGQSTEASNYGFPFMTAEMGGGVEDTYHRRPAIAPDDVAAMMPVMLGSGVNLYGTYMFQGGENPEGIRTSLQESQATGYPNDVPVKSYDFQAPLSEFGEEREVLRKLKVFNYFLNDFGSLLAPMVPFAPAKLPSNPQDFSVARVSVRSNGKSGFLFFNNYVRYYGMPARPGFQVRIKLAGRELMLPDRPVDLPSGAYGIWPFGLQLGSLHLRYATAQLFARVESTSGDTYYFVPTPGVGPQFVFEQGNGVRIESRGKQAQRNGGIAVTNLESSLDAAVVATDRSGRTTRIVLLSPEEAEDAWKLNAGSEHLLITHAQYFSEQGQVTLESNGDPEFRFSVVPPVHAAPLSSVPIKAGASDGSASRFSAILPRMAPHLRIEEVQGAKPVPPVRLGPASAWRPQGVAMAPDDRAFSNAAIWKIAIPASDWKNAAPLFLQISYDGDVARLTSDGRLLDDNFYNGQPWRVGLDRFRGQIAGHGLELEILPRRLDAPIFLERRVRERSAGPGQIDRLNSVTIVPQYRMELEFK